MNIIDNRTSSKLLLENEMGEINENEKHSNLNNNLENGINYEQSVQKFISIVLKSGRSWKSILYSLIKPGSS